MTAPTAIVTGAASGIGRAATTILLASGYRVAAFDLDRESIIRQFPDAGAALLCMSVDISNTTQCATAVDRVSDTLGNIDALLHFAAVWTGASWLDSLETEWEKILKINVTGTFFLARFVAQKMMSAARGSIVLTASDSAKVGGVAGGPCYVASKAAVIGLTHSLAKSLGPFGVRVNAINPGVVHTPMTAAWPQAIKDKAIELTPLGRLAQPDDIASVACFLASDAARFMTGEVVEVNGGFYFD